MRIYKVYIFILLLVLFAGCKEETKYRINFDHYLHVEAFGFECTLCHGEMKEGRFASAGMDNCKECHIAQIETDEISRDTCGKCHIEKDLESLGPHDYKRPTKGVFRHSEALSDYCRKCHIDTVKEGSKKVAFWTQDDVIAIRTRAHSLDFDCYACHEKINKDTPWENHQTDWIKRHGMIAAEETQLCTQCHSQENCKECHQRQAPSSHVNLWRLQTHAAEASWNRENCQVCHKDDFCLDCHTSTQPASHTSQWRNIHGLSVDLETCLVCHTSEGCSNCHSITKPSSHLAGAQIQSQWQNTHGLSGRLDSCQVCHQTEFCTSCHAVTKPRSHQAQDVWQKSHGLSGDLESCQVCHQPEFCTSCHSITKPGSHAAGWLNSNHCFQCHVSDASESGPIDNCFVCHSGGIELHDLVIPPVHTTFSVFSTCLYTGCHGPADGGIKKLNPAKHLFLDESECLVCHRL